MRNLLLRSKSFKPLPTNCSTRLAVLLLASAGCVVAQAPPDRIPLLEPSQMEAQDARIAAENQAAVARSAQIYGYTIDASYSYKQIACPVTSEHILLAYQATQPNGAASRFTAVLRRDTGDGQAGVQIVPIARFGVVPFLPASSNPHAIEVFNRAVPPAAASVTDTGKDPLLLRSLCYLAMIGEPPAALRNPSLDIATLHAPMPTLEFIEKGARRQVVSIRNSSDTYQIWNLTFSQAGALTLAEHRDHPIETAPPILAASSMTGTAAVAAPATAALPVANSEPSSIPPVSSPSASVTRTPAPSAPSQPVTSRTVLREAAHSPAPAPAAEPVTSSLPLPLQRFIPNPPQPPSRFIPDSATPDPSASAPK
jgi:hypothetical protein